MHRQGKMRRKQLVWAMAPAVVAAGIATSSAFGSSPHPPHALDDPMARNNDCPAPGVIAEFQRDDYCTDDLIRITGFRVPRRR